MDRQVQLLAPTVVHSFLNREVYVSHDSCKLYVADTNNHCVKIVNLESKLVSQVCHMYCVVLDVVLAGCLMSVGCQRSCCCRV